MVTKYSRLPNGDTLKSKSFDLIKWVKSRLPVPFLRQQLFLISLAIASLLLFAFTSFFVSDIDHDAIQSISNQLNYGVVVDCGSSGSRAHIFKWKTNTSTDHIELIRDSSKGLHITPGLSSLKDDPNKASDYMEPIMDFIRKSVPQDKHLDTPVHFLATAGLRLLDEQTQKLILNDITRDLRAKYNFPKIKSQVISGEFEGVYSWISLNMNRKARNPQYHRTYGMIEMGGASTQVTFELNPELENEILKDLRQPDAVSTFKNEQVTLDLGNSNSVKLFATTFLGLGVNSAREAAIDLLVLEHINESGGLSDTTKNSGFKDYEVTISDPCLTMGSREVVLRPTELLVSKNQTIGFVMKSGTQTFKVRLEGDGNFLDCKNLLDKVIKVAKQERLNCGENKHTCSINLLGTNFIPYQQYPFIGLSEMFFTTHEIMNSAGPFNRSKVLHETQRICGSQYNSLLEAYNKDGLTLDDRILHECFKATWLLTILHDLGFRMPQDYDNFRTLDQLDGEEIDWTTGAMIMDIALKKPAEVH